MGKRNRKIPNPARWITARFDGLDASGQPVKKGDRVFFTPKPRRVYTGQEAEEMAKIHLGP